MDLVGYTFDLLQRAFPDGVKRQGRGSFSVIFQTEQNSDPLVMVDIFRVGPHLIIPTQTVDGMTLQWRLAGWRNGTRAAEQDQGIQEDIMTANSEADIIGWVSWVRGKILGWCYESLARSLDPVDLFPIGQETRFRGVNQTIPALATLKACRQTPDYHAIRKALPQPIVWHDSAKNPKDPNSMEGSRFVFYVNSAVQGHVVGRFGAVGSLNGTPTLEYGIKVMVTAVNSAVPANITVKDSITDWNLIPDQAAAKRWLEARYFQVMTEWALITIPKHQLEVEP